jgi:hypothetical protein
MRIVDRNRRIETSRRPPATPVKDPSESKSDDAFTHPCCPVRKVGQDVTGVQPSRLSKAGAAER